MTTELNIQIYGDDLEEVFNYLNSNKFLKSDDNWQKLETIDFNGSIIRIMGECKNSPIEYFWIELSLNCSIYIEFINSISQSGILHIEGGQILKKELLKYIEYLYYYDNDYFWNEVEFKSEKIEKEDLVQYLGELYNKISEEDIKTIDDIYFEKFMRSL